MTLTPEQIAALPYSAKPAGSEDIAHEVSSLAALVAGIVIGSRGVGVDAMLADGTKEPGRSVVVQQVRLALALESWATVHGVELVESLAEGLAAFEATVRGAEPDRAEATRSERDVT